MPYTGGTDGYFKTTAIAEQSTFWSSTVAPTDARASASVPYAEAIFENSPLGKVVEQGASGFFWQVVKVNGTSNRTGNTVKVANRTNNANEVRYWQYYYANDPNTLLREKADGKEFYKTGELFVTETTDEDKNVTIDYKDKRGLTVLKKVAVSGSGTASVVYLETYYVYDTFGNLRFTVPPEATNRLAEVSYLLDRNDNFGRRWLFAYRYDKRNRVWLKRVPGTSGVGHSTALVYNKRDQVILTQDEKQRGVEWTFNKYDAYGRIVVTGLYASTAAIDQMQGLADQHTGDQFEKRIAVTTPGGITHGYTTNGAFPVLATTDKVMTVNYYDDYNFNNAAAGTFDPPYVTSPTLTPTPGAYKFNTGRLTAAKVRVINSSPERFLTTVNIYDQYGRVIQEQTDNHLGTANKEIVTFKFTFSNRLVESEERHNVISNTAAVTVKKVLDYDHAGRLLRTRQSIDGYIGSERV
jgi:hypothetical protein